MDDLAALDATAQAELVRRGAASALELVDAAIARIERLNPRLNAVIHRRFERARDEARALRLPAGPFAGVPFLLKDLDVESAGEPFHCGMRVLARRGHVGEVDSHLATRFRRAGLVILGRTNTPELGLAPTTEPSAYGPTRNPWGTERSAGGSSGGSAAAVAAGMVPAAHASDGGGSIRIPASACGLVGLKPSRGRVTLGPQHGECWAGLVISHVVTRSVRDTAALLDAIAGPMPGDPYQAPPPARPFAHEVGADPGRLRIGLMTSAPGGAATVHPACVAAVTETGRLLADLGHTVEVAHPGALDDHADMALHLSIIISAWVAASLEEWAGKIGAPIAASDLEPDTGALWEMGRSVTATQYVGAVEWMHGFGRRVASWYASGFDVLVTPTLATVPPELGALVSPPEQPLARGGEMAHLTAFTPQFNLTGQPAVSLPLHRGPEGLPVGVQCVAGYAREDVLIRLAAQVEAARPWAQRRPPGFG